MDIYIEDDELRIKLPKSKMSRLFVKGALQAEVGLGADGPEDFRAELTKARAAQAACRIMARVLVDLEYAKRHADHKVKTQHRDAAFAAGLHAGLSGEYAVVGRDPSFGIKGTICPPEHKLSGPLHRRGWDLGCAILAAVSIGQGLPDPRKVWEESL